MILLCIWVTDPHNSTKVDGMLGVLVRIGRTLPRNPISGHSKKKVVWKGIHCTRESNFNHKKRRFYR